MVNLLETIESDLEIVLLQIVEESNSDENFIVNWNEHEMELNELVRLKLIKKELQHGVAILLLV